MRGHNRYTIQIKLICKSLNIKEPQQEVRVCQDRRWRFDFAWVYEQIAVEIEGGAWARGRHTRGKGFISDMEKYNRATIDGWRILRYTPQNLKNLEKDIIFLIKI